MKNFMRDFLVVVKLPFKIAFKAVLKSVFVIFTFVYTVEIVYITLFDGLLEKNPDIDVFKVADMAALSTVLFYVLFYFILKGLVEAFEKGFNKEVSCEK